MSNSPCEKLRVLPEAIDQTGQADNGDRANQRQRAGDQPGALHHPGERFSQFAGRSGENWLVIQKSLQLFGQGSGGGIAAFGFLLQTFQTNRFQVKIVFFLGMTSEFPAWCKDFISQPASATPAVPMEESKPLWPDIIVARILTFLEKHAAGLD